jgi:octaprenyl-diphosphate synthase
MQAFDATTTFSLSEIHTLLASDFEQLNRLIHTSLQSSVPLIQTIGEYIVQSGGKRLRPLLALLAARSQGYEGSYHIILAAIVEFLHTATLLHDDVVDGSTLRRGRETVNAVWGNASSVLVGDFLYSRAFQLMTDLKNADIYPVLADATNMIAQGEVLQLIRRHQIDASPTHYLEVIRCKTATLFSAAAECGIVVAGGGAAVRRALALYGMHLGLAFQMIDDWLDYAVSAQESGKNPGDDLAEGKVTLPLIYAMQQGTPQQVQFIQTTLQTGNVKNLPEILAILEETGAEKYVMEMAQKEADLAKAALSGLSGESVYKRALLALTDWVVQRRS